MSRRTVRRLKPESIIAVLGRFRVSFRLMYLAAEFNRVLEPWANSNASDKFRRLGDTGAALIGRFDEEAGVAVPPNAAASASVGAVARVPTADRARCNAGDGRACSSDAILCTGDVCVMSKPTCWPCGFRGPMADCARCNDLWLDVCAPSPPTCVANRSLLMVSANLARRPPVAERARSSDEELLLWPRDLPWLLPR